MACTDKSPGIFMPLQPGDRLTVWLDKKSPNYYRRGERTITNIPGGTSDQVPVPESLLDPQAPLTYIYQSGEMFDVVLRFDAGPAPGKSAEVHVLITSGDGATVRRKWCSTIKSGPSSDIIIFTAK